MSSNERALIDEEYYSYEKYLWTLLNAAHHHKIAMDVIGNDISNRTGIVYPIYRMVIHPVASNAICIATGVHGNEIAGPLSILHLLSTEIICMLPAQYKFVIYPVINPSGFDLRQRFDADGRDLNAIYGPTLKSKRYNEVQVFFNDAQQFSPFQAVLTLHEDSDLEKFYMYGLGMENLEFYHSICCFAKTWIPAWENAEIYGCRSDQHGLVLATARDHAFDGALFKRGLTKTAFTLETPGKLDLRFRVNLMVQLILISLEMLASRRWMTSPYRQ